MPLQKTRKQKLKKPKNPSYLSISKGKYIEVTGMAMPHIVNAIKVLETELEVLRKELDFREFARRL